MLFVLYFYTMVQVWRITSVEEGLLQIEGNTILGKTGIVGQYLLIYANTST